MNDPEEPRYVFVCHGCDGSFWRSKPIDASRPAFCSNCRWENIKRKFGVNNERSE